MNFFLDFNGEIQRPKIICVWLTFKKHTFQGNAKKNWFEGTSVQKDVWSNQMSEHSCSDHFCQYFCFSRNICLLIKLQNHFQMLKMSNISKTVGNCWLPKWGITRISECISPVFSLPSTFGTKKPAGTLARELSLTCLTVTAFTADYSEIFVKASTDARFLMPHCLERSVTETERLGMFLGRECRGDPQL